MGFVLWSTWALIPFSDTWSTLGCADSMSWGAAVSVPEAGSRLASEAGCALCSVPECEGVSAQLLMLASVAGCTACVAWAVWGSLLDLDGTAETECA